MTNSDQAHAVELHRARAVLQAAGASELGRRPWEHPGQPPSDTDLVRFAVWTSHAPPADPTVLEAGLRLLSSARTELDQVEAGLLFAARSGGLTWPQVAASLGLGSPQAAQQRCDRVLGRVSGQGTDA